MYIMKIPRSTCRGIERQFVHSAIFLNSCFGPFREPLMPATFTYYTQHVIHIRDWGETFSDCKGGMQSPINLSGAHHKEVQKLVSVVIVCSKQRLDKVDWLSFVHFKSRLSTVYSVYHARHLR